MKHYWLYGLFMSALASPPAKLKGQVEDFDGGGNYSTMILPVIVGDKQYAMMSFCKISGSMPNDERRLYPPFASLSIAYPDKHTQWGELKRGDYGLNASLVDPDKVHYLGVIEDNGTSLDEWESAQARYPELISAAIEHRWLLTHHAVTKEERATAQELQDCARILYDKPLLPYYHHAGRQFFAWMERAAK